MKKILLLTIPLLLLLSCEKSETDDQTNSEGANTRLAKVKQTLMRTC